MLMSNAVIQIYGVSIWNDRFCTQGYFQAFIDGELQLVTCILIMDFGISTFRIQCQ